MFLHPTDRSLFLYLSFIVLPLVSSATAATASAQYLSPSPAASDTLASAAVASAPVVSTPAASAAAASAPAVSDTLASAAVADSAVMARLDEYLSAVDRLSIPDACRESDFIISSVPGKEMKSKVAERVYRHWRNSKLMGYEAVAIHVFDKWFAPFKTVFGKLEDMDEAEVYAFVNRSSLLGCRMTPLTFCSSRRDSVSFPQSAHRGRKSIVYFYSSDCPKCLYTSIKLRDFLNSSGYKVNLYTVYTLEDKDRWKEYISEELNVRNTCRTKVYHLYGDDVDYVVPYGVVQTPRLFLLDEDGVVAGRNLDVPALRVLLESKKY